MSDKNLPDVISASSLVLAVLAALYTLWLPQVTKALAITPRTDSDDRAPQREEVWSAMITKALPLLGASLAAILILLPRMLAIGREAWLHHSTWRYDDVKALLSLTYFLIGIVACVAVFQVAGLLGKLRSLSK